MINSVNASFPDGFSMPSSSYA